MKKLVLILSCLVAIGAVVLFVLSERRTPPVLTEVENPDMADRAPRQADKTGEPQGRVGLNQATDSEAIAIIEDEIGKLTPEEIEFLQQPGSSF